MPTTKYYVTWGEGHGESRGKKRTSAHNFLTKAHY